MVDAAVKAGANEVDDVEWNVVDPIALQAKAGGAALAKARAIADQMAKGLGIKVGELVYASNRAPVPEDVARACPNRKCISCECARAGAQVEIIPSKGAERCDRLCGVRDRITTELSNIHLFLVLRDLHVPSQFFFHLIA